MDISLYMKIGGFIFALLSFCGSIFAAAWWISKTFVEKMTSVEERLDKQGEKQKEINERVKAVQNNQLNQIRDRISKIERHYMKNDTKEEKEHEYQR